MGVNSTRASLAHLVPALADLAARDLLRDRPAPYAGSRPSFCSNDYLGLAGTDVGFNGPGGAGGSRLVVGENEAHLELEGALAAWLGTDAALLLSSGFAANVGLVTALAGPDDLIVSDALNHASLIDGCRLSRAAVTVVPHLDADAVARALSAPRRGRAWVVTESYFSMDADVPDLKALRSICDDAGAGLLVDESHALGVFGDGGRGLCHEAGVVPDALVGTLGKAFGRQGAFVAGERVLIEWLWNRCRSFVFSTGLSPSLARSALWSFQTATATAERRERCLGNALALRGMLAPLRPAGRGPIVPLVIGDSGLAVRAARIISARGVHVQAIRPPTVPSGTARIRLTATAAHTSADLAFAAETILDALAR